MLSRDALQDILNRMAKAYGAGDAAGCAALFALDAQLHSPFGLPAVGRPAILRLHEEWTAELSAKIFSVLDHGSTDTMAWGLCRFSEGHATGTGTSLIVLDRQKGGDWLIRSCCLYADVDPQD